MPSCNYMEEKLGGATLHLRRAENLIGKTFGVVGRPHFIDEMERGQCVMELALAESCLQLAASYIRTVKEELAGIKGMGG